MDFIPNILLRLLINMTSHEKIVDVIESHILNATLPNVRNVHFRLKIDSNRSSVTKLKIKLRVVSWVRTLELCS